MWGIFYYYTLTIMCLIIFLYNFFTMTPNEYVKEVNPPTHIDDFHLNPNETFKPHMDRLILIVIDALRWDLVNTEQMPFLSEAAKTRGCVTKVRVETPTVTLPRLKSLTTGSVSQFVDVVLNLGAGLEVSDSFLHQAKLAGKKIIFYGDDTWLKLYPDMFLRHEGVSSFFVNDYTEVDNNVTRNVHLELDRTDWDIMILHFLGLDHIGHVYGPFSPLVPSKLFDMDNIIQKIISSSETWSQRTFIAVTGDHGMKDSGGHGGSSLEEVHVPFVSIGRKCQDGNAFQTDLPTTLSLLMGFNIPSGSIGRVLSHIFPNDLENLLYLHYYNIHLLKGRLDCGDSYLKGKSAHYEYLTKKDNSKGFLAQKLYEECSSKIAESLIRSSVKQDFFKLLTSSSTILLFLILSSIQLILQCQFGLREQVALVFLVILQTIFVFNLLATICYLLVLLILILYYFKNCYQKIQWTLVYKFVIFASFLHGFSFFSSSFVEEEHLTFYFFWAASTSILTYISLKKDKLQVVNCLMLSILIRFARTINQTGDKWANSPDLADWLLLAENRKFLYAFFAFGLISLWAIFYFVTKNPLYGLFFSLIFTFRTIANQNFILGQIIWFLIFAQFCLNLKCDNFIDNLIKTWILCCALLLRPYNVILLSICIYCSQIICKTVKDVKISSLLHILLGKVLYFCQGHSNSLSSIDVACGYIGLTNYIPVLIFFQLVTHTYCFPILANLLIVRHAQNSSTVWAVNMIYQTLILLFTIITNLIHRQHLFVWSVFAPKLLFEVCHSLMLFFQVLLHTIAIFLNKHNI